MKPPTKIRHTVAAINIPNFFFHPGSFFATAMINYTKLITNQAFSPSNTVNTKKNNKSDKLSPIIFLSS